MKRDLDRHSRVSVKLTTARRLAQRLVDLTAEHLGRRFGPCMTASSPALGRAQCAPLATSEANSDPSHWSSDVLERMTTAAVDEETALTLSDVVFRRTTLGHFGCPTPGLLQNIGNVLRRLFKWSADELVRQIEIVQKEYDNMGLGGSTPAE